ncbi:MAG: sugar transferase [Planctomycetota bacterium]|jgi:exopolysaccharide biosynthesis polyprenyl glycosylphosphotransferase
MFRRFSIRRIVGLFVLDWAGTLAVLLLSAYLRDALGTLPNPLLKLGQILGISLSPWWIDANLKDILAPQVFVLVALIWPFFLVIFSVYDGRHNETLKAELFNVLLAICVSTMTLAGALYFTYRETPRILFLIFFVLDVALLLGSRVALWAYRRSLNGRYLAQQSAVIVIGAGPVGQGAVRQFRRYDWPDLNLIGYIDDDPSKQGQQFEGLPVLGTPEQIPSLVQRHRVREALVALPLRAHERLVEVCETLQTLSVRVHVIPDLFALSFPSAALDSFGNIPVINLGRPITYDWQRFFKRLFDTLAASLALALLSPFLLVIAALVKLGSPGPVLYKQQRIGEHGQPFTMLKFRSMRVDADPDVHKAYVTRLIKQNLSLAQTGNAAPSSLKMEHDPRITPFGRLIRKTSIDELPQLFNVLRGEMSLVGPRPHLPYEVDLYQEWHKRRLDALPGVTGWWQVRGRNVVSFDEMVRMDIYYVEHRSFWLDLKILLMTPRAVLSGKGAG